MDGLNEKKWFVYMADHHEGPFSLLEIQAKMAQSQVTTANYVWAEGMTDWKPMPEVAEFEAILKPSPPPIPAPDAPAVSMNEPAAEPGGMIAQSPIAALEPEPGFQPEISDVEITGTSLDAPVAVAAEASAEAIQEEKTGDLDPADLKRATEQKAAPAAAMAAGPAIAVQDRRTASRPAQEKPKRSYGALIAFAIVVLVPGALAAAYFSGKLDPVLSSPAFKAGLQTVSDFAQPYLLKLADKVPALAKWVSPIPSLEDVVPEDYELLKGAAMQKIEDGVKIAVAVSTADVFAPVFYVSSNLPDGAVIDVYVEGIPDTLLNQLSFSGKVQATLQKKLGKSGPARFADGKPLPRGEYIVYATEGAEQPDAVKALLAGIPPVTAKMASVLPRGLKLLVSKPVFLGGNKDATYQSRLKEFHDKLRAKATGEITEVKQLQATLEGQLAQTTSKYNQLRGLARKGKIPPAARKSWNEFNSNWNKLDDQLKQSYAKWTEPVLQTEYFYGVLYSMTRTAGEAIERVHQLHDDFFGGKKDVKTFEIEHGSAVSVAGDAINALKNKVSQAENLAPTPNGMPRREGL